MAGDLLTLIRGIGERLQELERRNNNRRRTGTIAEGPDDKGRYRVELSRQGGVPYLTPWIRPKTVGAGNVKLDVVYAIGEQVDVVSESGDLTDARIDFGMYSDDNPRENDTNVPLRLKVGDSIMEISGSGITLKASKIVLDGEVHLGGEGGQLLHRKGDADSDGDTAVGSASRVYAV
ncbi:MULTISPECIES: phage baseplate assembly protein V [unclassified Shinella]|uniref:phage baseplate assembly protein V n=1 Tax=unclassified Shinella TaxID=2643062 RepID=UPI00225CE5A7|nr:MULTISPECIES: phage baseplate assembly protein V [unclassified Shinella]MCO5135991.1 phage baseplate assembly protein V [Shinella sp.]MDC7254374.1 phage baseplate assembly protein V [Shinella sp. YE25]CAI0337064.1 Phage P2 baseplate assembly protein GpV [Rhizobiaceae bacterium]CAK7255583.1 Phage P2 baseplate assembly protein GpV [Shinella sp. WSC3-e]